MPADSSSVQSAGSYPIEVGAAVSAFDIWQLPGGTAGFLNSSTGITANNDTNFTKHWIITAVKATGFVGLAGGRAYWDHSANAVSYKRNGDRDFYLGRFVEDAASADTTCTIDLSQKEWEGYSFNLRESPAITALIGTPAAGAFGYPVPAGGGFQYEMTATNEAQKVDHLGVDTFANTSNMIIEFAFNVTNDGAGSNTDVSIGVANGTHASDASAIAQRCFMHLDGNATDIRFESADGVTVTVSLQDSTTDYTEGSTLATRKEVWMDFRNPADVQMYVDGVLVLNSVTFDLSLAASEWQPLIHVEKALSTDVYKLLLWFYAIRISEQ